MLDVPKASDELVAAIKALTKNALTNSAGLPEGIYRPDMLVALTGTGTGVGAGTGLNGDDHDLKIHDVEFEEEGGVDAVPNLNSNPNPNSGNELEASTLSNPDLVIVPKPDNGSGIDGEILLHPELFAPTEGIGRSLRELGFDERYLANAYVPITYNEGFPTLPDGSPFWSQLDFEPLLAYKAFEVYLGQASNGFRSVYDLMGHIQDQNTTIASELSPLTSRDLIDLSHLYYWSFRSRAYDLYSMVLRRKERERRALSVENYHYQKAEGLLRKVFEVMEKVDDDGDNEFFETMTPKVAVELMKTLMQVQRVSVGLPANGPLNPEQQKQLGNSLEVSIHNPTSGDEITIKSDNKGNSVNIADLDLSTIEEAQDLVIKIQRETNRY